MPNSKPSLAIQPRNNPAVETNGTSLEPSPASEHARAEWAAEHELQWYRAETRRLKVLVDFLSNPVHAHGGTEPDPDIITAYNLAVEAALKGIRRTSFRVSERPNHGDTETQRSEE